MTAETTLSWNEIYAFLSQRPRISTWPPAEVEQLARDVVVISVPAGGLVFDTHYQADDAYLVYSGQVRQSVASAQGVEWWHRTLHDGEFFTQQALFRGASYASTAKAELDSVLLRVSAAILSDLLTKHPELWVIFYTNTAARLQAIPLLRSLDDDQIERLSVTAEEKSYEAGEPICTAEQAESYLYLIDRGQVRITQQMQTELSGGGQLIATAPTPEVVQQQGFRALPHVLTAGNYFVGGLMRIPHQLSVTAVAATKVSVIRIAATYVEQLEERFSDVQYVLRHRPAIAARLKEALHNEPLFADLTDDHWAALETITGWEHVPSNLDVTRQGQIGAKLYVLSAGAALVRATDDDGKERPRHYTRVGVRDFYGINALLRGDRHGATVRSMVENGPLGEPLDGTDWLTLQHDDALYLAQSNSEQWNGTRLWQELSEKPKEKTRYSWQEADEEVVLFRRRHWLWLAGRLALVFAAVFGIYALLVAADKLLSISLQGTTYALVAIGLLGLPVAWFVVDYLNDYYIITTKRVLRHERVLVFYENQQTAPLERIQDVTSQASIFGKLFNYALLTITTAGMGVILFEMIPLPDDVEGRIRALQGKARAGELGAQRENLRNKILSRLKIRLTPDIPDRVLPADMSVPPQLTGWQRFWHRITNPWRRFWRWLRSRPEAIYLTLIRILPKHTQEKLIMEREAKKRREIKPMEDDIVYRKHPWFLLKAVAIPLAVIGVTAALVILDVNTLRGFRQDFQALGTAYTIFLLICIAWLWFRVENWRNDKYILTKTHITYIYKIPLGLYERRRQAEWEKVQNANYVIPGLWANLINFGTVVVETASVEGKFEFENIGSPRKVQQEVMLRLGLTRAAQAQRTRDQQQTALSETLEIYNELIQDWAARNQWVGAPPPPGVQTPGNGQPPR
ncbi:MAG TPA: cyclic nucleotide-binding domain-containing protein [Anaerolineae bacterium]|nr:cyclic nucleotide-binding domain-containing protein [Anaerolineae bacterium]